MIFGSISSSLAVREFDRGYCPGWSEGSYYWHENFYKYRDKIVDWSNAYIDHLENLPSNTSFSSGNPGYEPYPFKYQSDDQLMYEYAITQNYINDISVPKANIERISYELDLVTTICTVITVASLICSIVSAALSAVPIAVASGIIGLIAAAISGTCAGIGAKLHAKSADINSAYGKVNGATHILDLETTWRNTENHHWDEESGVMINNMYNQSKNNNSTDFNNSYISPDKAQLATERLKRAMKKVEEAMNNLNGSEDLVQFNLCEEDYNRIKSHNPPRKPRWYDYLNPVWWYKATKYTFKYGVDDMKIMKKVVPDARKMGLYDGRDVPEF